MRTIIIEDEVDAQSLLQKILDEYCLDIHVLGAATGITTGISLIQEVQPDFIFLDIQLIDGTAFELLEKIEDINFDIIFTTAFEEYALKAFDYDAVHYILKPYSPKSVMQAVERVKKKRVSTKWIQEVKQHLSKQKNRFDRLSLNTADGIELIDIDSIIGIEADRSYSIIKTIDGKRKTVSKPLSYFAKELEGHNFFRSHDSHLIHLKNLKKYCNEDGGYLLMIDESVVPLARRRKAEILKLI